MSSGPEAGVLLLFPVLLVCSEIASELVSWNSAVTWQGCMHVQSLPATFQPMLFVHAKIAAAMLLGEMTCNSCHNALLIMPLHCHSGCSLVGQCCTSYTLGHATDFESIPPFATDESLSGHSSRRTAILSHQQPPHGRTLFPLQPCQCLTCRLARKHISCCTCARPCSHPHACSIAAIAHNKMRLCMVRAAQG
jgi:hypothetical protein